MATATSQRSIDLDLFDFSGGLNARDGFAEVAANELRDGTLNWTLDERSAITVRKGCPAAADFPVLPGNPKAIFYSAIFNVMIVQVGTGLYKCAPGAGAWTAWGPACNSTASFVDFNNEVVFTADTGAGGGTWTYDGAVATNRVNFIGVGIAAWQNKVWVAGTTETLAWSNAGDAHTWTSATDFVDIREKDQRPLKGLFGGPTLVVFKETSTYRVNDSTSGTYTTVDWNAGAVGGRAIVGGVAPAASGLIQEGGIFAWGLDGLYAGDGLRSAILVGDKLRPRFIDYSKINATTKPLICAGIANGRIYFGFPKSSASHCDTVLEYHPRDRWMVEHQIGSAQPVGFASYQTSTRQVTLMADGNGTKLIELNTSDTRTDYDASSVAATLKTGYVTVAGSLLARMRHTFFTITAAASSVVTFAASYLDDYAGTEQTTYLTFGSPTVPAGTSRVPFNGAGRASAFSFTVTCSGVSVTLRRILAKFYPVE